MEPVNEEEIKDDSEQEILDFDKPAYKFEQGNCDWRQQGPYLVCKSCEIQHFKYVGVEKIMVGIDEKGRPILKDR